jgi:hypothetical protein
MNDATRESIDRALDRLERQSRGRRWRFTTAPIVLGLGLALGNLILSWFVPTLWESMLPGGFDDVSSFRGLPRLVWKLSAFCQTFSGTAWDFILVVVVLSVIGCWLMKRFRYLVWVLAAVVVAANAGILLVAIKVCLTATLSSAGL